MNCFQNSLLTRRELYIICTLYLKSLITPVFPGDNLFLHKHNKTLYYTVPLLAILTLAFMTGFFSIDRTVINKAQLGDTAGRPYETFLYELNLPSSLGAVFVAGTPDNLEKTEKYYKKVNIGDIFTSQLRSLLFGTKITAVSIASYINFVFGVSAVLFSLLVGYLIFKNGYISILVFLLFMIFRNSCQGLIYGLPLRHAYAVFNPLLASCIVIFIVMFLKSRSRRYWTIFVLSGFIVAYIAYCRTSEGQIIVASLILFTVIMSLESLKRREDLRPILISISIIFATMYAGYFGYYKMVTAFEKHRDKKFNFPPTKEKVLSAQPAFHGLFIGLFRYPNEFGYSFHDLTGYDAVYKRHPELKEKFSADIDYVELANSEEYSTAMRRIYFDFVSNNPKYFFTYLIKSTYDYFLFLPYYSWTGEESAHAYIPTIDDSTEIEPGDIPPYCKGTPGFILILNLRLKYLPESPLFWIYFVCAYLILIEAIYTSFIKFRKTASGDTSISEAIEANLSVYLLRGMLIYFFLASIVRILIPVHGQGAVVAFNTVVIYNLVRIVVSIGTIEMRNIGIPTIKIPAIKTHAWLLLLIVLSLYFFTAGGLDFLWRLAPLNGEFERHTTGWNAYKSTLASVSDGQSGNCLQITTTENAPGYAYAAVPTRVNKKYEVTAYFRRGSTTNCQIKVGTKIDTCDLCYSGILSDTDWTQYRAVFRATTTTTYITLVNLSPVSGLSCFFDSVTFKRFKPQEAR